MRCESKRNIAFININVARCIAKCALTVMVNQQRGRHKQSWYGHVLWVELTEIITICGPNSEKSKLRSFRTCVTVLPSQIRPSLEQSGVGLISFPLLH